jgi:phosphoribosylformimino-5-aminoimidazole carboxamide ribotide isomerase
MITIIPAIDLIDGKCVRLQQGDYERKKIYNENPVEVAKEFEDHGITHLHLVDLDGAKAKHVVNHAVLEKITASTRLHVDFGGGVKSDEDIRKVFEAGANQVTIGSIAATDPALMSRWIEDHGADKIILGADVKDRMIAVSGWLDVTGLELNEFLKGYLSKGISYVLCTDISRDGMLQGTALELYKELNTTFPGMKLIASGGITTLGEIDELEREGIYGAIVGKAIYEGRISLKDLARFQSK